MLNGRLDSRLHFCEVPGQMHLLGRRRLVRQNTEAAQDLEAREAAAEEERRRVRARLTRPARPASTGAPGLTDACTCCKSAHWALQKP